MTFAVIAGTIGIVLVTVAIGVVIERKVGVGPKPEVALTINRSKTIQRANTIQAGDTAATAVRASADRLTKLRTSQKCAACGGALAAAGDDERVRYGGGELLLVRLACGKCGRARTLYVDDRA